MVDVSANALAADLAALHASYERVVAENAAMRRQQLDVSTMLMENETLRKKLRLYKQAQMKQATANQKGPPSAFGPSNQQQQAAPTRPQSASGALAAQREIHKLRDENKSLRVQVLQLNALARQKDAEIQKLMSELGQRAPMKEEVMVALDEAVNEIADELAGAGLTPAASTEQLAATAEELLENIDAAAAASTTTPANAAPPPPPPPLALEAADGWTVEEWLQGMDLPNVLAEIICSRVREAVPPERARLAERALVCKIGRVGSSSSGTTSKAAAPPAAPAEADATAAAVQQPAPLVPKRVFEALLRDADLAAAFSERLGHRAKLLAEQTAARAAVQAQAQAKTEVAAAAASAMAAEKEEDEAVAAPFGPLPMFYSGLAGLIGTPDPSTLTMDGMREEHCEAADAAVAFTATECYGTRTTSLLEWWFVYDPDLREANTEAIEALNRHRKTLGLPQGRVWPIEARKPPPVDARTGRVPDGEWVPRRPEGRLGVKIEERRRRVNGELRKVGEAAITQEELIAGRLFTGPMGVKYNAVLKALGAQQTATAAKIAEGALGQPPMGGSPPSALEEEKRMLTERYESLCSGNTYTMTLTTLATVIGKLGRVLRATTPLYLPIGAAPGSVPVAAGGGVAFGFLELSPDRRAAMAEASLSSTRMLLELKQGALDRGADLKWLSQYGESESRLVLPPMSAIETEGKAYISGVERLERQSGRGHVTADGGEVVVVGADVKVAWPRTAAGPGRLKIAQLERTRNGLEGKLAEAATKLSNLETAHAELRNERDELKRELVLRTAKFQRERQKDRMQGRAANILGAPRKSALAEPEGGGGGGDGGVASSGMADEEVAAALYRKESAIKTLEAEKAELEAAVARAESEAKAAVHRAAAAEAKRLQAAVKEARHQSYLERYQEEKLAYGYEPEELLAPPPSSPPRGAAEEPTQWASAKDIVPPAQLFLSGSQWHGAELAAPADPIADFEATLAADPGYELRASMRDRADFASGVKAGSMRAAGGKHTKAKLMGTPGSIVSK